MVATQTETYQVLVVEDDRNTSEVVTTLLRDAGYDARAVRMGQTALSQIAASKPDLVLIDLRLPDIHGLDILRSVRSTSLLPMIAISGFDEEQENVAALEAGADDFLSKPFSHDELLARVKALLRRTTWVPRSETRLQVRDLVLDISHRQAIMEGERVHLTPTEYGLVNILMTRAGHVVSHTELLARVWGEHYERDYSVLRVNISRLRHKLEEDPRHPKYIVTVAGRGYTMPAK